MQYATIDDIYQTYDKIYKKFENEVSNLTQQQEDTLSENSKWTIGGIVEHVAISETGIIQICYKLLSKAKENGETSDGSAKLSESFLIAVKKSDDKKEKFEAPEVVQPKGGIAIADSILVFKENRDKLSEMKPMFETVDGTKYTFPHPVYGAMTAQDWLALLAGHIARHNAQIKRILAQN